VPFNALRSGNTTRSASKNAVRGEAIGCPVWDFQTVVGNIPPDAPAPIELPVDGNLIVTIDPPAGNPAGNIDATIPISPTPIEYTSFNTDNHFYTGTNKFLRINGNGWDSWPVRMTITWSTPAPVSQHPAVWCYQASTWQLLAEADIVESNLITAPYSITFNVDHFSDWTFGSFKLDNAIHVTEINPEPGTFSMNEGVSQVFSFTGHDPDGHALTYDWKLEGSTVSNDSSYTYSPDYNAAGSYALSLTVSDEVTRSTVQYNWTVNVQNVDRPITVTSILPAPGAQTLREGDSLTLTFEGSDPDGNPLLYSYKLDGVVVSADASYTYTPEYTAAGAHALTLDVTDSTTRASLHYEWPVTVTDYHGVADVDYQALVALYTATDGANWTDHTNWMSDNPVNTWNGITVTDERVTGIQLESNHLNGTLPAQIINLDALTSLRLGDNLLTGSLPADLQELVSLTTLSLYGNSFAGTIPTGIGSMSALQSLDLHDNHLTGGIPTVLGNLSALRMLRLDGNLLAGTIPPELGSLSLLASLHLGNCGLTGSIPPELTSLPHLETLDLGANDLTGAIPAGIGSMAALQKLVLNSNQLSGSIPVELGNLNALQEIYLYENELTGAIPAELGNLTNLRRLSMGQNQLTGTLPEVLGNLTSLEGVWVNDNQLSGPVPATFSNLTQLQYLDLTNNGFTSLPALTGLTQLHQLKVGGNALVFGDLEPNNGLASEVFSYTPQDSVLTSYAVVKFNNSTESISAEVSGEHNNYRWFHDGSVISGANDAVLTLSHLSLADQGFYTCEITNSMLTALTLQRRPVHVSIDTSDQLIVVNSLTPAPGAVALDEGASVNFTFSGYDPDGHALLLEWRLDGALVDSDSLFTYSPDFHAAGEHTLTLHVNDGSTRDSRDFEWTITVNQVNLAPNIALPESFDIRQNEMTTLNFAEYIEDGDADTLTLTVIGDNHLAVTIADLSVVFTASANWIGTENLTFTVNDHHGGVANATVAMNVYCPLTVDFSTNSTLNNNVVAGDERMMLHFIPVTNLPAISWAWDLNNDGIVEAYTEVPMYLYTEPGLKDVRLTVSDGIHVNTLVKEAFINVLPGIQVPGQTVTEDCTWTEEEGPYNITGILSLAPEVTLQIMPGTEVNLLADSLLVVDGSIVATGAHFNALGANGWGGVRMNSGATGCVIDGLTVSGATTAFTVDSCSPVIRNVTLRGPVLPLRDTTVAIRILGNASPTLENLDIRGFTFGVDAENSTDDNSSITISNASFIANSDRLPISSAVRTLGHHSVNMNDIRIAGFGSGIRVGSLNEVDPEDVVLTNVRIRLTENSREPIAAIRVDNASSFTTSGDSLDVNGTGISVVGSTTGSIDSSFFTNMSCAISLNGPTSLNITNNEFRECGIALLSRNTTDLGFNRNRVFQTGDTRIDGSALSFVNSTATLDHNTVYGYLLPLEGDQSSLVLANSIVWNNSPVLIGLANGATVTASYSDIASEAMFPGTGNLLADPLFADAMNGNLALTVASPCINAGSPTAATDADGSVSDIGALPFNLLSVPLIASFTAETVSGDVPLTVQFTSTSTNARSWNWDFDSDGVIDNTEENPSHTYTSVGTFTVALTVSDGVRTDTSIMPAMITVTNPGPEVTTPLANMAVDEDFAPVSINLNDHFVDGNGETLTYSVLIDPAGIDATIDGSNLLLTSHPDWFGAVTVTVTANDNASRARTRTRGEMARTALNQTFTLTVNPINDSPVVASPFADMTLAEDFVPASVALAGHFSDVDNANLVYSVAVDAADVVATIENGNIVLVSTPDWNGTVIVTVTANDGVSRTRGSVRNAVSRNMVSDSFPLTVTPVNDAPVVAQSFANITVNEDFAPVSIGLDGHFSDIDSALLTYTATVNPAGISAVVQDNNLVISPVANWSGSVAVTVTANDGELPVSSNFVITVNPVNDGPTLVVPFADLTLAEDFPLQTIDLPSHFADIDNASLGYSVTTNQSQVTAVVQGSQLLLSSVVNWNGTVTVTVTATDNITRTSVSDAFDVVVTPVNDVPVVANVFSDMALNEDFGTIMLSLDGHFTDVDSPELTYSVTVDPTDVNGYVEAGNIVLNSTYDWNGIVTVTVTANDGVLQVTDTFTLTVNPVNDAPYIVEPFAPVTLEEDFGTSTVLIAGHYEDVDGDAITYSVFSNSQQIVTAFDGEVITLTSVNNWYGDAIVTVFANDGAALVDTTFTVHVAGVNDAPVVAVAFTDMDQNEDFGTVTVPMAGHFTDIDNPVLAYSVTTVPTQVGAWIANGVLTLTSVQNYSGDITVTITADDGMGRSRAAMRSRNRATVSDEFILHIASVNDAPVLSVPFSDVTANEDFDTITIPISGHFTDVDNATLTYTATTSTGTVSVVNNNLVIAPAPNWNGTATITVTASDGSLNVQDQFLFTVTPVNDAPVLATPFENQTIPEDTEELQISLQGHFTDIDNPMLTYSVESDVEAVSASVANGFMILRPELNWNGTATITVTADDGLNRARLALRSGARLDAQDTFTLTVSSMNDTPIVSAPFSDLELNENFGSLTLSLANHFTDVDGDELVLSATGTATELGVNVVNGNLILTSVAGWFGTTSVIVTAEDGNGLTRISCSDTFLVVVDEVGIDDDNAASAKTRLVGNYPNPFNGETHIRFNMAEAGHATINVYNLKGQLVATPADGAFSRGEHSVAWNGKDLRHQEAASGVYLMVMKANGTTQFRRITYMK
jgi:Leucine-rich repeat (LRR) protein/PKD repeat protein